MNFTHCSKFNQISDTNNVITIAYCISFVAISSRIFEPPSLAHTLIISDSFAYKNDDDADG